LRPAVVVTGGSDGIGLAIAARFARTGRDVVLVARNAERLAEAARKIGAPAGVRVGTIALDVTAVDAPARLEAALAAQGAYTDVLVNCAAMGLSRELTSQPPEKLAALVDLNIRALTLLCRHFLPAMRVRRRGGIVNLGSLGGFAPGPGQAAYYASKAYVISLSEALASEVAGDKVRVMAVAPGPVATAFHARMGAEADYYLRLLPVLSPANVAWWVHMGFGLGMRVVVPGIVNSLLAPFMKVVPHRLLIPFVAWLLRPRQQETGNAGGKRDG
jgi:short-subunit dehydrogenase